MLRTPKKEQKIQNLEVERWIQGSKVPAHLEVEPMKIHQIQRSCRAENPLLPFLLHLIPLSGSRHPQDLHRLLIVLENIEKLGVTVTVPQKPAANRNGSAKSHGKEPNRKHKGNDSSMGDCFVELSARNPMHSRQIKQKMPVLLKLVHSTNPIHTGIIKAFSLHIRNATQHLGPGNTTHTLYYCAYTS
jgi:hypothetical protein